MNRLKTKMSFVSTLLVMVFGLASFQAPVQAAMMTSQDIVQQNQLQSERTRLQERLLREDVKSELLALGVSPAEVEQRIGSLTMSEISAINGQLDSLPAGGDALGTVLAVILILILLEAVGAIDIFPRM